MTRPAAWISTSCLLLGALAACDNVPDSEPFWLGGAGASSGSGASATTGAGAAGGAGGANGAGATTASSATTSSASSGGACVTFGQTCSTNGMCCGFTGTDQPGDAHCVDNGGNVTCAAVCNTDAQCASNCCIPLTGVSYGACFNDSPCPN